MNRISLLLFAVLTSIILYYGCEKSTEPETSKQSGNTNTGADTLTQNSTDHEDENDYVWNESEVIPITFNGTSITSNTSGITVNGSTLTITSAGTYSLSGTLSSGQIIVNTTDEAVVRLILNGANITCSSSAPVYVKDASKVVVVLPDNTTSTLTDGSAYVQENAAVDEPNAALYSKSDLTIYGNGSLKVTGNYNDGIASIDGLIIKCGYITVNAADDGIRGKDYLIVKGGNVTVSSKGNGLKSDNAEDLAKGYVSIESGTLNIAATGDGISAQTDAIVSGGKINITSGGGSSKTVASTESAKAIKGDVSVTINGGEINLNSADDGLHSNQFVKVNDGTITISTGDDGIHAESAIEINNGEVNIVKSVEGIESANIVVNNGTVNLISSDDGFNATTGAGGEADDGSWLSLKGGNVCVNTTRGDGLDSNGDIETTGGTVVVHGPSSQPEVGTDYNGTFNISGGLLVLTGPNSGHMIEATSTSSAQYTVKAASSSQVAASTLFNIQDNNGNNLVTFKPVRSFYYILFSSPDLQNGATYNIYTGGTSTGTDNNGLYTGGTYSGGTLKKSFTISSKVTSVTF